MIEKIEKLEKLSQLRELNISFNSLTKIENLQTLTSLQILNMSGNQIEHIPNWLPKKLKALRTFRISKNNIQSVGFCTDVTRKGYQTLDRPSLFFIPSIGVMLHLKTNSGCIIGVW